MFPGMPRSPARSTIYDVGLSTGKTARYFLRADDPERVLIDVSNANSSAACVVTLPPSAPFGKSFVIGAINSNGTITIGNTKPTITVVHGASLSVSIGLWGEAVFVMTRSGWVSQYTSQAVVLGNGAKAYPAGVAIGYGANGGNNQNVALGYASSSAGAESTAIGANTSSSGNWAVALGMDAVANTGGTALGTLSAANTTTVTGAATAGIGIGKYSRASRRTEFTVSADQLLATLRSYSWFDWFKDTTDATPVEILLGNTTGERLTLQNSSALIFTLAAIARNNVDDVTSGWELKGVIKRGANAAATALVGSVTKTVIGADAGAATWDIAATADTTNGALLLTITGETGKTIRWNVRGDVSEIRF